VVSTLVDKLGLKEHRLVEASGSVRDPQNEGGTGP
jgi:hypothetical protein